MQDTLQLPERAANSVSLHVVMPKQPKYIHMHGKAPPSASGAASHRPAQEKGPWPFFPQRSWPQAGWRAGAPALPLAPPSWCGLFLKGQSPCFCPQTQHKHIDYMQYFLLYQEASVSDINCLFFRTHENCPHGDGKIPHRSGVHVFPVGKDPNFILGSAGSEHEASQFC